MRAARRRAVAAAGAALLATCAGARPSAADPPLAAALAAAGDARADSLLAAYGELGWPWLFTGDDGATPLSRELCDLLAAAGDHGLRPADYRAGDLRWRLASPAAWRDRAAERARLEADLARALATYAADLGRGRADPRDLEFPWHFPRRRVALRAVVLEAARTGSLAHVARLAPRHEGYATLRDGLRRYRRLAEAGGWPATPRGPVVRPGEPLARAEAAALRYRLAVEYPEPWSWRAAVGPADTQAVLGPALVAALRDFQRAHGLTVDGVLGPATRAALGVTAEQRRRQIELNLERWRWLPAELAPERIVVNVPAFELTVFDAGREVRRMPVVVGREGWETPAFGGRLRFLVFNPYWFVPATIAADEILPRLREDPGYLRAHGLRAFATWDLARVRAGRDPNADELDPSAIDWAQVDPQQMPVCLRQDPGPENPLGPLKFMFPNEHSVYLHGTSSPGPFQRSRRALSHGCIRVADPVWLAAHLLRDDSRWDEARVRRQLAEPVQREVRLGREVDVYIVPFTAFVEADGRIEFRDDVYGLDARTERALAARVD